MSNVIRLHGPDPLDVLDMVRKNHEAAIGVIAVIIDADGAIWHYTNARDSHIAWAGARLLHIAGSDLP